MKKLLIFTTKDDFSAKLFEKVKIDELDLVVCRYNTDGDCKPVNLTGKDYIYLRDPFNSGNFNESGVKRQVETALSFRGDAKSIDRINSYDDLVRLEDKWEQYKCYEDLMPRTSIVESFREIDFEKEFVKKRISSRARGIIFNVSEFPSSDKPEEYIVQERLDITNEYRINYIFGEPHELVAQKSSKTATQKVRVFGGIKLSGRLKEFAQVVATRVSGLDLYGIDVAETVDRKFVLLEVNRSNQFAALMREQNFNLAEPFLKTLFK